MTDQTHVVDVPIGGEFICLGRFLKFAGLFDSGRHVEDVIPDGCVTESREVDRRRGRQLQLGDIVSFAGRTVHVCP